VRPHLKGKFALPTRRHHEKVPALSSPKSSLTSPKLRLLARSIVPLIAVFMVIGLVTAPASANRRQDAMAWALRRIGCSYSYGGTSCRPGFDCSGLVVAAYAHVGMRLPRTTYAMLHSPAIVPQHPLLLAARGVACAPARRECPAHPLVSGVKLGAYRLLPGP
jgi:NlpC/P60 family protein